MFDNILVGLSLWQFLSLVTIAAAVLEGGEQSTNTASSKRGDEAHQSSRKRNFTNIVILLADNLAYDDVGVYSKRNKRNSRTPNLDRAAMEGRRLLNWNSPAVLCSASRAALLTGECVTYCITK